MEKGVVIKGIDILDVISFATRKNKRFQAVMLNEIENILGSDTEEYKAVRKIVLDGMNNYGRSIIRTLFGGVEDLLK